MSNSFKALLLFVVLVMASLKMPLVFSHVSNANSEGLGESIVVENKFEQEDNVDEIDIDEEDLVLSEIDNARLELKEKCDEFYNNLKAFDDLYYFDLFQVDYVFRDDLATSDNLLLYFNAIDDLDICNELLEKYIKGNEIVSFNSVLSIDENVNVLNSLYNNLLEVCEIRQKLEMGVVF